MRSMNALFLAGIVFLGSVSAFSEETPKWKNTCDVYFAPDDQLIDNLITFVNEEKEMIKIAVSNLSNKKIIKALIDAHSRGVDVEIVLDENSVKAKRSLRELSSANIPIFFYQPTIQDDCKKKKGISKHHMHNRFCLFGKNSNDEKLVWTGTFNFTHQANELNRENVVVASIEGFVAKYEKEFDTMKQEESLSLQEMKLAKK